MIEKLKEEVIRKIACGEVIFRPASCVKELIENSLDANSKRIVIEVRDGGKKLIKVSDDGWGMEKEELFLAIERYSTSKLRNLEDLKRIKTYGFRGEALAAIASCALLRIESSVSDGEGYYIEVKDGRITNSGEITRKKGTTVYVKELFYNYPVRRNFLKSSFKELRAITEIVKNYSLSNYSVSFCLKSEENKIIFNYPEGSSIKERVAMILDKETFSSLWEIFLENPTITLYGFISDPEKIFLPATLQIIFFNLRPVKSQVIKRAIYDIFSKNPNFILFIETPGEYLDVNVHPTKEEVRFIDEKFLYDFIREGIKEKLKIEKDARYLEEIKNFSAISPTPTNKLSALLIEEERKLFWQLHNKYIFTPIKSGLCIIDQHAASERILFEKLMKSEDLKKISQPLLFPIIIELKSEVFLFIFEMKEELEELGLSLEHFGENTIAIKSCPIDTFFAKEDLKELLLEIYNNSREILKASYEKRKEIYAKLIACKGAIKANQKLNEREMERLTNQLFSCDEPYLCPHGRPTIIKFEIQEFDKKFGR